MPPMTFTGVNASGVPIQFAYESPGCALVRIVFSQTYMRNTGFNQFAQNSGALPCAPGQEAFVGNSNNYTAGMSTSVGPNEAAALVAAGIASYG